MTGNRIEGLAGSDVAAEIERARILGEAADKTAAGSPARSAQ